VALDRIRLNPIVDRRDLLSFIAFVTGADGSLTGGANMILPRF
jgi:hypothetical protein